MEEIKPEDIPIYTELRLEYQIQEELDTAFGPTKYRKGLHTP